MKTDKYKIKAFTVIDTNVLIAMLRTKDEESPITKISYLIDSDNIIPIFDERMLSEYYAVLNYSRLNFSENDINNIMCKILNKGIYVNDVKEIDIQLIDNTDIPFYEVMMDTYEMDSTLVTGNMKHFPEGCCVSPRMLINNLNHFEKFICPLESKDYDELIHNLIIRLTSSQKYYLAKHLPEKFVEKIKEKRLGVREHIDIKDYIK